MTIATHNPQRDLTTISSRIALAELRKALEAIIIPKENAR